MSSSWQTGKYLVGISNPGTSAPPTLHPVPATAWLQGLSRVPEVLRAVEKTRL